MIFIITFITAFCSMIYEMNLIYGISIVKGSTLFQYNLVLGFYIFSLGMGALLIQKIKYDNIYNFFFYLETILVFVGLNIPFYLVFVDFITNEIDILNYYLIYSLVFLIGILSGMELPILINISQNTKINLIIALDYLAMFIASLSYPVFILPYIGMIEISYISAFLNFIVCLFLYIKIFKKTTNITNITFFFLIFFLILYILFYNQLKQIIKIYI